MSKKLILLIMNTIARSMTKPGKRIPRWRLSLFSYFMSRLARRK